MNCQYIYYHKMPKSQTHYQLEDWAVSQHFTESHSSSKQGLQILSQNIKVTDPLVVISIERLGHFTPSLHNQGRQASIYS